jgi:hypothetical protein
MSDESNKEITPSPRWKLSKESDFLITPEKAWDNLDGIDKRKLKMAALKANLLYRRNAFEKDFLEHVMEIKL